MRTGLPAGLGEVRIDTKRQIGEAKNLIDNMKSELYRALDVLNPPAPED